MSKEKKGNIFVMDGIIYTMKDLEKKAEEIKDEELHKYAEPLVSVRELSLKGKHNLKNMLEILARYSILLRFPA